MMGRMTAEPVDDVDPDDPVEILRVLHPGSISSSCPSPPPRWRLSAAAFSDPGYETRRQAAGEAVRGGRRGTPIEEIVPDWAERIAAARRQRAGGGVTGLSSRRGARAA